MGGCVRVWGGGGQGPSSRDVLGHTRPAQQNGQFDGRRQPQGGPAAELLTSTTILSERRRMVPADLSRIEVNDNAQFDARSIANLLLDLATEQGLPVTNLALQKLLYFTHGLHLSIARCALVDGYFEAWTYGPVHPHIYQIFKVASNAPISWRATRTDYATGRVLPVESVTDPSVVGLARRVVATLGKLSAGRLVALSHVPGGPWHTVANEARTKPGRGLRIPDMLISDRFDRHKLAVDGADLGANPDQEAPLT